MKRPHEHHASFSFAFRILVALLLLCTLHIAQAANYSVDQKNPAAADSNDGTVATPFKTISSAVAHLKAGDTLTIHGGVYRETLTITASGTEQAPITVQAAAGETVIINGADLVTGWERVDKDGPIWKKQPWKAWAGVVPKELDTRASKPQIIVDNVHLTQVEDKAHLFPGTFCYDATGAGTIYLWMFPPRTGEQKIAKGAAWWDSPVNLSSNDPNQHQVEVATRGTGIDLPNRNQYIALRGLHVRYGCGGFPGGLGIALGSDDAMVSHVTMEDCSVEDQSGPAVALRGSYITVRRCYFRQAGISSGAIVYHSLVEDCVFDNNSNRGISHGWSAGAIKFLFTVSSTVRRCQFINNDGPGLWFDTGNSDNIIEQNYVANNYGPGIMMEVSPTFSPDEKGRMVPMVEQRWGLAAGLAKPNVIRNNICVNNHSDGTFGSGILLQLSSNCIVANNTVVGNEQFGIFVRYHPYGDETHRCQNNTIINNIVMDNGGDQIFITPDPLDKPGFVSGNRSDHNLFWDNASWKHPDTVSEIQAPHWNDRTQFAEWGKTQSNGTYSVEEWYKMRGYDQHSLQWDPRFVSPATFDYRLNANSPAISAGEATAYVTDDFLGRPRPVDRAPSIGALEYFPTLLAMPTMPMGTRLPTN